MALAWTSFGNPVRYYETRLPNGEKEVVVRSINTRPDQWCAYIDGESRYFPSAEEAMAAVEDNLKSRFLKEVRR